MKPLIVANWKCNPVSLKEAKSIFDSIKKKDSVIICPPFIYLPLLKGITLGAQDCFWENKGSFTGEISPLMLKRMNIKYVILGHSERRNYFKETNNIINQKVKKALKVGLKVILCIGEKGGEDKKQVLEKQLKEGLKEVSNIKNVLIAYEPVWAIGTGKSCSVEETISSIILIRKIVSQKYGRKNGDIVKILYGGSVNSKNAESYIKEARADGLLIGGASLKAKEFARIIEKV